MNVCGLQIGKDGKLLVIAGPCVIEDEAITMHIAQTLKAIAERLDVAFIFKASVDKANRTSVSGYRGRGFAEGLALLDKVKRELGVPILTDVHTPETVQEVAEVVDMLQIPAFLCRQTDLVVNAASTQKPVNIKKGQFLAPWDMQHVLAKAHSTGNEQILLTERGTSFGYNNLVVDMRSLPVMSSWGAPVIFDMTHSVQLPGGAGGSSSGQRAFIPPLARAAVAAGVDGLFLETHPNPAEALSDGPNSIPLDQVEKQLQMLCQLHEIVAERDAYQLHNDDEV